MNHSARVLFAALLVAAPALADDLRIRRALDVAAPGWVRVPLDAEILRKSVVAGGHLRVLDPRGLEVPVGRTTAEGEERRAVVVTGVEETPTGWWLVLDLGAAPVRHDGLVVELTQKTLARGCRLESSADGTTFTPLAVGDLFRLGDDSGLAVREIRYPATGDRHLRLFWPAAAGYPEVESVAAAVVSSRAFQLESGRPECQVRGEAGATTCRLNLAAGSAGLRRLDLAVKAEGAVGFRLSKPVDGRWQLVAEGLWTQTDTERSLPVEAVAADTETLRLELFGESAAPVVERYRAEFDGEQLVFEARTAGRYELIYGAGVPEPARARSGPPPRAVVFDLVPGPEDTSVVPGLPLDAQLGAVAPEAAFARRFRVAAPDHAPGLLFRLALPEELYGVARADLGDVRFLAAGRQVPFLRFQPEEPVAIGDGVVLTPKPDGGARSHFEIPWGAEPVPLSQLSLTAPPGVRFQRRVSVRWELPERPGAPRDSSPVGSGEWSCQPVPPLPCRFELDVDRVPAQAERLVVEIADGDDAPVPSLTVELWRRLDVLLFFWPQTSERVTLEAGATELAAPRYELEARRGELLARPWRPASVIAEAAGVENGRRGRWILLASLGGAALFLLALLHRILKEREGG
ncbi:MAG: DUF3999 family protein [Thermoanaerobaculia bacterium]|nr:DUF3999 family protein [Thermoanaerobaculia bacterium]